MKQSTTKLLNECTSRMNGYVTLLCYRYMNLPIKAEPASLLPIKVNLGDDTVNFEDAADASLDGEFKFVIYPKERDFMESICAGVTLQHPEFKQEIQHMEESEDDEDKVLILTMPDVDDDRYKALTEAVKALDKDCKTKMDATFTYYTAQLTIDLLDADSESKEEATKQLENMKKKFEDQQKEYTDNKMKEIEDAHNAFLAKEQEENQTDKLEQAEKGTDAVFKMKMN